MPKRKREPHPASRLSFVEDINPALNNHCSRSFWRPALTGRDYSLACNEGQKMALEGLAYAVEHNDHGALRLAVLEMPLHAANLEMQGLIVGFLGVLTNLATHPARQWPRPLAKPAPRPAAPVVLRVVGGTDMRAAEGRA